MLASPYGLPRIVDPRVMQFVQQTDDAKVNYIKRELIAKKSSHDITTCFI